MEGVPHSRHIPLEPSARTRSTVHRIHPTRVLPGVARRRALNTYRGAIGAVRLDIAPCEDNPTRELSPFGRQSSSNQRRTVSNTPRLLLEHPVAASASVGARTHEHHVAPGAMQARVPELGNPCNPRRASQVTKWRVSPHRGSPNRPVSRPCVQKRLPGRTADDQTWQGRASGNTAMTGPANDFVCNVDRRHTSTNSKQRLVKTRACTEHPSLSLI